jgi:hypothetical protein
VIAFVGCLEAGGLPNPPFVRIRFGISTCGVQVYLSPRCTVVMRSRPMFQATAFLRPGHIGEGASTLLVRSRSDKVDAVMRTCKLFKDPCLICAGPITVVAILVLVASW